MHDPSLFCSLLDHLTYLWWGQWIQAQSSCLWEDFRIFIISAAENRKTYLYLMKTINKGSSLFELNSFVVFLEEVNHCFHVLGPHMAFEKSQWHFYFTIFQNFCRDPNFSLETQKQHQITWWITFSFGLCDWTLS